MWKSISQRSPRIIKQRLKSYIELFQRKLRHLIIWKGIRNGQVIRVLKVWKGHRWLKRKAELWFRCKGGIRRELAVKGASCRRLPLCNQVKEHLALIRKVRKRVWPLRIRCRSQRTSTGTSHLFRAGHSNRRAPFIIKAPNHQLASTAQRNAKTAIPESASWKSSKTQREAFQPRATEVALTATWRTICKVVVIKI